MNVPIFIWMFIYPIDDQDHQIWKSISRFGDSHRFPDFFWMFITVADFDPRQHVHNPQSDRYMKAPTSRAGLASDDATIFQATNEAQDLMLPVDKLINGRGS